MNLHRHKLRPVSPSGPQTAPVASPPTPARGGGREPFNTSTAATGRGTDATREVFDLNAPRVTAGGVTAPSAESFTRRIKPLEVQQAWCHNVDGISITECHVAIHAALARGDEVRAGLYARHVAVMVRRSQASVADELYGGAA